MFLGGVRGGKRCAIKLPKLPQLQLQQLDPCHTPLYRSIKGITRAGHAGSGQSQADRHHPEREEAGR
jgi:hypothetical protein